jgi:GTP-binding protein EngB required for normal cell division
MPSPHLNIRTRSGLSKQSGVPCVTPAVGSSPPCPATRRMMVISVRNGGLCPRRDVFPPNHQRYLFSRFHYIDETLGEALQALQPTDEGRLFRPLVPDATPAQRKILADYLAQLRFVLRNFIEAQQLQEIPQNVSGLWSVRSAVIFAQNAVTELRPEYLRGYGALDVESTTAAERLVAELSALLKRIEEYLEKGAHGDLASRLAQLDSTRDEIPLLRELERIITVHGLVELRAPLEAQIERAAAPRFEIAVFGRVNSGKSSLLNWWLGQPVLPTGVVPVTAVLTRIVHGDTARAHVRTASGPIRDIALDELPGYVTEVGNPRNAKRILEVLVESPCERLSRGISLVDTPGLGSIASAGAARTLDYLPHCDLGIQLVEATGALDREDIAVARAILDGGSDVVIALSKADRLSSAELEQAQDYIRSAFVSALGVALSVRPISTLQTHAGLASEWFEAEVSPRLETYRERAAIVLKRKVAVLRETVIAVLSARLNSRLSPSSRSAVTRSTDEQFSQMRADLERARADLLSSADRVRDCTEWLTAGLAKDLARLWLEPAPGGPLPTDGQVRAATARRAAEIGDVIGEQLNDCRMKLRSLRARTSQDPNVEKEFPEPRGRPIYDAGSIPALTNYARPRWALGMRSLLLAAARNRVNTQMRAAVREQLSVYSAALRLWGVRYLDELVQFFDNALAATRDVHRSLAAAALDPEAAVAMRRDLEVLEQWPVARDARMPDVSVRDAASE